VTMTIILSPAAPPALLLPEGALPVDVNS